MAKSNKSNGEEEGPFEQKKKPMVAALEEANSDQTDDVQGDGDSRVITAKETPSFSPDDGFSLTCHVCGWMMNDPRELINTSTDLLYCPICGNQIEVDI